MFIKRGDDPKTKIVSVIDSSDIEDLNDNTKVALDKMKEKLEQNSKEGIITKESN